VNTCGADVAGPSSASRLLASPDFPILPAAPPSAWAPHARSNNRRTSTHSAASLETEFTDLSTDSDGEYEPALSPVAESPASVKYPPRARLTRRCSIRELPAVNARVAIRRHHGVPGSPSSPG